MAATADAHGGAQIRPSHRAPTYILQRRHISRRKDARQFGLGFLGVDDKRARRKWAIMGETFSFLGDDYRAPTKKGPATTGPILNAFCL